MRSFRLPCRPLAAPLLALAVATAGLASGVTGAAAQPEKCPRMVAAAAPLRVAALGPGTGAQSPVLRLAQMSTREASAQASGNVRLSFIGHATFLIESPAGVTIATDYNDYVRPAIVPDVVTMNRAHDTHYTDMPEAGIAHVLRGWNPDGGPVNHELTLDDVWIRNVPTNIRRGSGTLYDGNSMFVFEVAGVCIAHLGHLHHLLTPEHVEALGRIDVVLAPVDGSYTLDLEGMVEVLKEIGAPLVIPMHYFSSWGLERFLTRLGQGYKIERSAEPTVLLSRESLPREPTVLVLPGR
ncbi:MBL fold metallo-hydrolase [Xanthobacter pseudotagetidis]|uniref:MBL fold metallo-hydrolase n=1 Tax=Xanthobacter pseudotagetidis TaxID=3119911 RepID=UPI00372B700B